MFLPTTTAELKKLKWDKLDVILVTGDAYIDSPFIGVAVIGQCLLRAGYRVGIIAQPDCRCATDICRLGEPELFWGITGGCMDSLVANYTAVRKKRKNDDLTAGGKNNRRPDRAVIAYANLIRQYFKNTRPLVLGGVEASLRRIAHYDYWSNSIRRSILFDAKADILVYGMGEKAILEIADELRHGQNTENIRGSCHISAAPRSDFLELPAYEQVTDDKAAFQQMFTTFYQNNEPAYARGLSQRHGARFLIHNPPQPRLTEEELDNIYALNFARAAHPFYLAQGKIKALDTIKFSLTSHRGCYGECNFCSIGLHEGRTVVSRSEDSIIAEAQKLTMMPDFRGYILDIGGATANMYGFECLRKQTRGACRNKRCLYPRVCTNLKADHSRQTKLLSRLRRMKGIKKVFVASGLRYDLLLSDKNNGTSYLREVVQHHVSGQLKVAPEHTADNVLKLMGKPSINALPVFKNNFEKLTAAAGKKQFLTYYFIAAHPGCTDEDMRRMKSFAAKELKTNPEQVQIFTPLPSTWSALMYWTGIDPFSGRQIFIERDSAKKQRQKNIIAPQTGKKVNQ
ncbi:MAG TPA: YgiQ family radical SAM protein [Smithellaceae bacterium]|nr:YgiQ family radical SAM protein [Smithellaceae bacterium]